MKHFANSPPLHPGNFISQVILPASQLTASQLARGLRVTPVAVHHLLHGRSGITPNLAVRLSAFFGSPARQWLDLQRTYDVAIAELKLADELAQIAPYSGPPLRLKESLGQGVNCPAKWIKSMIGGACEPRAMS